MDSTDALALRTLLQRQPVASLATLHQGEPAISMVPYALLPGGQGFVIHVSQLATHTHDMESNPAVGLMVTATLDGSASPLSLPRASVRGRAQRCEAGSPEHALARDCYLAKLPQSEELFSFADFSLFVITAHSLRFVAGFGRAMSITAVQFAAVMDASA